MQNTWRLIKHQQDTKDILDNLTNGRLQNAVWYLETSKQASVEADVAITQCSTLKQAL